MEKNEVYDYLAKIYLDKREKPEKIKRALNYKLLFFLISIAVIITPILYGLFNRSVSPVRNINQQTDNSVVSNGVKLFRPETYSLYLSAGAEPIKINYEFIDPSLKKEVYALTFANLDVRRFSELQFRLRRMKKEGMLNLKVEVENGFQENSAVYVKDISDKWKPYTVKLKDFSRISHWENIKKISFIAENWNVQEKSDCVYIDDIKFIKEERG